MGLNFIDVIQKQKKFVINFVLEWEWLSETKWIG